MGARRWWYGLLLVPVAALTWLPLYARVEPRLIGIPFFYWYQFAWAGIAMALTTVVYRATRARAEPGDPAA